MAKKIFVSDLEFDEIKTNLKEFLSSQSEFTDYNFEGSGLSVLLDVLAYNTHYNALYDNMLVNESFLDSATKRESVVSRAADLGYIPRSAKCSKMHINLTFNVVGSPENPPGQIAVPAFSPFKSNTASASYTFYNPQAIIMYRNGNQYVANNVLLLAGKPFKFSYVYEGSSTRFVIPNQNCDIDTIRVLVFDSASQSSRNETFVRSNTIIDVTSDSKVYWIREIDNFLYELKFGDGIIGKKLLTGNLVVVDYMTSYGSESNGIRSVIYSGIKEFAYLGSLKLNVVANPSSAIEPSYGGDDIESIESIKFNAPRAFSSQNRAVTVDDYKSIIMANFSDARSVTVWGGEDNYPPEYGKVFICVSQNNFRKLSSSQKAEIISLLRNRKVVTVTPVIIDTEYIELALNVSVYYNERETTRSIDDIREIVLETIYAYNDSNLEKFDGILRYSRLTREIDNSDKAIVNSNISIKMYRKVLPRYNVSAEYLINLINPIKAGSFNSTGIYIETDAREHFLDDDGKGNIRLYYYTDSSEKVIRDDSIGTINYDNGIIRVFGLNIVAITGDVISFFMEPSSKDIVSSRNQIVRVLEDSVNVVAYPDKTSIGDLRAGKNYNFS